MYRLILRYGVLLLSCLTFASGTRAQYVWHVVIPNILDSTGDKYLEFQAVSCNGDNCTASAQYVNVSLNSDTVKIEMFRSTDGGISWTEQDPGLPVVHGQNQIDIYQVRQVDSLNIVGTGDSGLIIHTFDGGKTWERQDLPIYPIDTTIHYFTVGYVEDIHFSDAATGIAVSVYPPLCFTTSDSGRHWNRVKLPYSCIEPWACHSYGGGMFRVMSMYYGGTLFTTRDNWQTYDSSFVTGIPDTSVQLGSVGFGSGDTIIAGGRQFNASLYAIPYMTHSVDGGKNWSKISIEDSTVAYFLEISSLDRNFIFAGGENYSADPNAILLSTDYGETWQIDTIPLDTTVPNEIGIIESIAVTGTGHAVMIPGLTGGPLTRLELAPVASVEAYDSIIVGADVYPNPATEVINITSYVGPLSIIDPLGRSYQIIHGGNTLDISSLPSGVYFVSDGRSRAKFVKE